MLSRSSTTQAILDQLRLDIILCRFENESQVREQELADRYCTSRAAVRNALMILEYEGMVVTHDNGTKSIRQLTLDDIYDLYDMRSYIENKAIEQIFSRPNRDFSKLLEILNRLTNAKEGPIEEILALDAAFHREIIAVSGNSAITQAWDMMDGVTEAIFRLNMTESSEYEKWYVESVVERHKELFVVLLTDEKKCKELSSSHIHDALIVSVKAMERILLQAQ